MARPEHVHSDMQSLYDARSKQPAETLADRRRQWGEYAARLARPVPAHIAIEDRLVPVGGRDVPVRIYAARQQAGPSACIIYMHGGGFMLGDLDSSDSIAWGYAEQTGATVVSVDYRLSPENPWPAAFDDCYGVIEHISNNPAALGVDPARLALAGDSAGGRLTAGLCIRARDERGPRIAAQAMIYASAGAIQDSRSAVEFADGYGLTTARYQEFYRALFPDNRFDDSPSAWPIKAQDLSNLPPALVHPAEFDPIRDDGRAYAARLAKAGTEVVFREAKGMIHGFMRARFFGAHAKAEFDFICGFLRQRLQTAPTG